MNPRELPTELLGSLVCEEVGLIFLGSKSVTIIIIKKKTERDWKRKKREKRREKGETHLTAQISSKSRSRFICSPIELKFGGEV